MRCKGYPPIAIKRHSLPSHTYPNHYVGGSSMFHDISHSGPTPTAKLIKVRYFWLDMEINIQSWVRSCLRSSTRSQDTLEQKLYNSLNHLEYLKLCIDVMGPLLPPITYGGVYTSPTTYVLTCTDREIRWCDEEICTLITLSSCGGGGGGGGSRRPIMVASKNQRTIVVSRIMKRKAVSPPTLSIITR